MAYNAVAHEEHDDEYSDHFSSPAISPRIAPQQGSSQFQPVSTFDSAHVGGSASSGLYLEQYEHGEKAGNTHREKSNLAGRIQSAVSKASRQSDASYDILEGDDYAHGEIGETEIDNDSPRFLPINARDKQADGKLAVQRQRPKGLQDDSIMPITGASPSVPRHFSNTIRSRPSAPPLVVPQPIRTASTHSPKMRHPTPDLQALQGAYVSNIEHLEKTAEKLSMTSSIDEAIRQLHQEQKRADSRRSSMLSSPVEPLVRHFSNASSIVDLNNTARSGGYSPAGYAMASPRHSLSGSHRGRSSSKGSRFGTRTEPEMEGRPLDLFVLPQLPNASPLVSRSASIAEQDEGSPTLTKPMVDSLQKTEASHDIEEERPTTRASIDTFEHAQHIFQDFDGEHYTPGARGDVVGSRSRDISGGERARDISNGSTPGVGGQKTINRTSMARPTTYADPSTGQQMVFYPAPVPMMLNLPQKLSKRPASSVIEKRRTQILSNLPPAARQSAVWLPDVLEAETDQPLGEDHPLQGEEYLAQHQRQSMGGRRTTADLQHMPPQLRANAFFEQPSISAVVDIKESSAVATLDSILDASAYAPVNAFTDHAFAGRLGAEVYGVINKRETKTMSQLGLGNERKRRSSSNLLLGARRSSSGALLDDDEAQDKRRSTMSTVLGFKKFGLKSDMGDEEIPGQGLVPHSVMRDNEQALVDEEEDSDPELEGQFDDEVYRGPPTTLLAELQLRKQQNKARVRPMLSAGGMHTTFMEREAVAAIESKNRKKGRINLAWEDPNQVALETQMSDDEDVPLGVLFQPKNLQKEINRPMGLVELRDMEDNEPLSRRRDRITGRTTTNIHAMRATTMSGPINHEPEHGNFNGPAAGGSDFDAAGIISGLDLPDTTIRPVSGDFASEMMSHLGIDDTAATTKRDSDSKPTDYLKSSTPALEEEETLGQRRKRLQAEKEARAREVGTGITGRTTPGMANAIATEAKPVLKARRSMADLLQAHPAAGAGTTPRSNSGGHRVGSSGLLGMHEQIKNERASTMLGIGREAAASRDVSGGGLREQKTRVGNTSQYGVQQTGFGAQSVYGGLGDYSQQQLMMPHAYTQMTPGAPSRNPMSQYGSQIGFGSQLHLPQTGSQMGGLYGSGGAGGGLYGAMNPMAQSMMQLQMQMDQMAGMMAERQNSVALGMGQGQVDMVERWREGVRP